MTYLQVVMLMLYFVNNHHSVLGGTQSDTRTKLDSIKSLIYSNAKATVTLDSTALKELVKLLTSDKAYASSLNRNKRVSFSVYTGNKILTFGKGQTIRYDGILTNDGNGYDDRTGVFVCPVAGTYMFVVDTLSNVETWLALKVNKKSVANVFRSIHYGNRWGQTSRTVIVNLKHGDHVKVDTVSGGNLRIFKDATSGFSGTLLY
ncbi:complement C1q subcomponent subunit B-like [Saccostrea cucullata]|uniref:complement C1q subcomponent subunit B-like n=1 Tax=Saccostrea cuccullata TaxID=36930 RepID=UPI002ED0099C